MTDESKPAQNAVELWTLASALRQQYLVLANKAARGERAASAALAELSHRVVAAENAARAQQARETITEWRPQHAPHVVGSWTQRVFDDDGMPEPQTVKIRCEHCGDTWQTQCASGLVHAHVQRFALAHLHRDVLNHVPRKIVEDE